MMPSWWLQVNWVGCWMSAKWECCLWTGMAARSWHAMSRSSKHGTLRQRYSDWRCHRTLVLAVIVVKFLFIFSLSTNVVTAVLELCLNWWLMRLIFRLRHQPTSKHCISHSFPLLPSLSLLFCPFPFSSLHLSLLPLPLPPLRSRPLKYS